MGNYNNGITVTFFQTRPSFTNLFQQAYIFPRIPSLWGTFMSAWCTVPYCISAIWYQWLRISVLWYYLHSQLLQKNVNYLSIMYSNFRQLWECYEADHASSAHPFWYGWRICPSVFWQRQEPANFIFGIQSIFTRNFVQKILIRRYKNILVNSFKDFHEEYAKVAFKRYDPEGTGFISSLDFNDIILSVKSHLLTPDVKANLVAVKRIALKKF